MGQKVNPHSTKIAIIKDWDSKYFSNNSNKFDEKCSGKVPGLTPSIKPRKSKYKKAMFM